MYAVSSGIACGTGSGGVGSRVTICNFSGTDPVYGADTARRSSADERETIRMVVYKQTEQKENFRLTQSRGRLQVAEERVRCNLSGRRHNVLAYSPSAFLSPVD
jgi:hypothetical protein